MENLEIILKKIDTVFKRISNHKLNPDLLLEDANALSTLLYNLGEYWITAREESDFAEMKYKDTLDDTFIEFLKEDGMTQGKADVLAKKAHRDLRNDYLQKRHLEEKINILRKDVERKISVLQSYSNELRSQRTREIQ